VVVYVVGASVCMSPRAPVQQQARLPQGPAYMTGNLPPGPGSNLQPFQYSGLYAGYFDGRDSAGALLCRGRRWRACIRSHAGA
jgi:hypothetical protein